MFNFVVSLFWCLTSAYSEKFVKPKNSARQVDFSSTCQSKQEIKLMSSPAVQSIISHLQI